MPPIDDLVVPPEPLKPESCQLSHLDQQMFGAYVVRFIVSFPLSSEAHPAEIFKTLQLSLANTIAALPFIAGHVVICSNGHLTLEVKADSGVLLRQKDLTSPKNQIPGIESYQQLKDLNFPVEKVPESAVAPVGLFPENFSDAPAVVAQCSFLKDGVMLCVAFHHSAFDTKGSSAILERWAEERRSLQESGAKSGSIVPPEASDRIIPFPPAGIEFDASNYPDLEDWTTEPEAPHAGPYDAKIRTFHFTPATLGKLKALATSKSTDAPWISTNDALSALLWHAVTRARNPDLLTYGQVDGQEDPERKFACAVDIRARMKTPNPNYFGNASFFEFTRLQQSYLLQHPIPNSSENSSSHDIPLARTAQAIRQTLNKANHKHIQHVLSLVASTPTTKKLRQIGGDKPFLMNSWAEIPAGRADWGTGLGKPDAVRIPMPDLTGDGAAVVLPKAENKGGLDVLISMNGPVLNRVTKDLNGWCTWAE